MTHNCQHNFLPFAGQLAARKQKVISNANLAVLGHHLGLARYITLPCDAFSWATGTAQVSAQQHQHVAYPLR